LPTSGTTRRIRLPGDLARSLEYLDDAELRKLQDAVNDEIKRRSRKAVTKESVRPADKEAVRIPEGRVNLIRVSFKAGLKPAAIARCLCRSFAAFCSRTSACKAHFATRCYPDEPLPYAILFVFPGRARHQVNNLWIRTDGYAPWRAPGPAPYVSIHRKHSASAASFQRSCPLPYSPADKLSIALHGRPQGLGSKPPQRD
jgi:hypothetical protein